MRLHISSFMAQSAVLLTTAYIFTEVQVLNNTVPTVTVEKLSYDGVDLRFALGSVVLILDLKD
jgi:hypothetical protein